MKKKDIIKFIKKNKATYKGINFSWHSYAELLKIKEIVELELKIARLDSELEKIREEKAKKEKK